MTKLFMGEKQELEERYVSALSDYKACVLWEREAEGRLYSCRKATTDSLDISEKAKRNLLDYIVRLHS